MAITYASAGAGVATETLNAALSPLCPATVNAGQILLAHVYAEGILDAPSTPSGWTLLHGPEVIQSTIARHWVFGKIAAGTEDGTAVAFGAWASTNQRAARVYAFNGRVSGTITDCVRGFAATSHATDPQMPAVTTTVAGSLAVAFVAQNDNNAFAAPTGESGGDWVEAVAEYVAALTPGLALGIETAAMASVGTISGGAMATTNDPCGVIGFEVRDSALAAVTGAGVANSQAADLAGSGTSGSVGNGALVASAAALSGFGTVSDAPTTVVGSGVLASVAAALSGFGVSRSNGSGVLIVGAASLSGFGTVSFPVVTGSGVLLSDDAQIDGNDAGQAAGTPCGIWAARRSGHRNVFGSGRQVYH